MAFPGTYNFNYYRGDRYEFVIRPKNVNGDAFNLQNYNARFKIANERGEGKTQYQMQAVADNATDTVTCTILPVAGENLVAGTYVYDVQIDSGAALVFTLLTGTITVVDDITGADDS